jgi:transglutaminase-like putative cysteine protease
LNVGGDQIKRKGICSVILLLTFALILNVNASSAATVNGTSSINSSVNSDLSPTVTNPTNSISANTSKSSTNLVSTTTKPVTTVTNTTKAVVNTTKTLTTSSNAVSKDTTKPKVIKTNPANNRYVFTTTPGQSIIVTFSERVTLGSGWVVLVNSKGVVIPFKLSISGNAMTINPYSDLINGMVYGVLIHTGSITDHSGNSVVPYVFRFGVQPKASAVPASLNPYLLPSANCQSTNPKIIALAKSITKGSTSQYTSAVKIYNWVRDNINYAFYYNTQKGALGTLSSRSANCADTAHLMVALERAAGIPARYEHIYAQFSSGNWYGHVIAQVYVNGKWYYADGTSYRNSFGVVKNWNTGTFKLEGVYRSLPF